MTVKFVISGERFKHLEKYVDGIEVLKTDDDGYKYISFEIKGDADVLRIFHAGTDAGLELGLYGPKGKPVEEAKRLVEIEEK
jgi:hypothetical protein